MGAQLHLDFHYYVIGLFLNTSLILELLHFHQLNCECQLKMLALPVGYFVLLSLIVFGITSWNGFIRFHNGIIPTIVLRRLVVSVYSRKLVFLVT